MGLTACYTYRQNLLRFISFCIILFCFICDISAQSSSQNYIQTTKIKVPVTNPSSILNLKENELQTAVQYLDGLGRPVQTINVKVSPLKTDVVQVQEYDAIGREAKKYLPYVSNLNTGLFVNNATSKVFSFYAIPPDRVAQTCYPYAESSFDGSALNVIREQGAPGETWQLNKGHTIKIENSSNALNEVILWLAVYPTKGSPYAFSAGNPSGYYTENRLYKTLTTDENGSQKSEFKDKAGRIILKRQYMPGSNYDTYYLYDDKGNLVFVLPPKATAWFIKNNQFDSRKLPEDLIFCYVYDERNRKVEEKIPGKEWIYYCYDDLDRLILMQDAKLRPGAQWIYTKYDRFSHITQTGILTDAVHIFRDQVQSCYRDFDFDKLPALSSYVLTENYYDNYDFIQAMPSMKFTSDADFSDNKAFDRLITKPTGSKTRILGQNKFMLSVIYYDAYGRIIQTIADNHLDGIDVVTNGYDFEGKLLKSRQTHSIQNGNPIVMNRRFEYDHAGRLTSTWLKVNNQPEVLFSAVHYNVLGQMVEKNLHSENKGAAFLQSVDFSYNIRGWLSHINNATLTDDSYMDDGTKTTLPCNQVTLIGSGTGTTGVTKVTTNETPVKTNTASIIKELQFSPNTSYTLISPIVTTVPNVAPLAASTSVTPISVSLPASIKHTRYNDDANDLFGMELSYDGGIAGLNAQPLYNGNISGMKWQSTQNKGMRGYGYQYDRLNRILKANYGELKNNSFDKTGEKHSLTNIIYDENGNILKLDQNGQTGIDARNQAVFGNMDKLSYSYKGNQLIAVDDAVKESWYPNADFNDYGKQYQNSMIKEYDYDDNGNMISDNNKGIKEIKYNHLNLPYTISFENGKILYLYAATGTKLQQRTGSYDNCGDSMVKVTDYIGSFVYENRQLAYILTEEGRLVPQKDGTLTFEYFLKDHLGNTRVVFGDPNHTGKAEVLQESSYYPYGLTFDNYNAENKNNTDEKRNRYLFNGIEFGDDLDMNLYGMFYRQYDPQVGRWWSVDPKAENYEYWSSYHFSANNPIFISDPDGMDWYQSTGKDGAVMWKKGNTDVEGYKNIGTSYTQKIDERVSFTFTQNEATSMTETVLTKDDFESQMTGKVINGNFEKKPGNEGNCYVQAGEMVKNSGTESLSGEANNLQGNKGIEYLNSQIDKGSSVRVHVDRTGDGKGDHWVAISSRTTDLKTQKAVSYGFADPAGRNVKEGMGTAFKFNSNSKLTGNPRFNILTNYSVINFRKNK
jgi:RHS repeat-associated protein